MAVRKKSFKGFNIEQHQRLQDVIGFGPSTNIHTKDILELGKQVADGFNEGLGHKEKVNHPSHYNSHPSGIECIVIIESMPFNVGSAIKYLWRAGLKDDAPTKQDFEKAIWYIKREIERLKL